MSKKSNRTNQKSSEDKIASFQLREAYKTARTNIAYSIIKKGCKKITFTSSIKGEGKTVTSTNIAHAMSQQVNTKVLIVECDLRMPKVHTVFNIEPTPGLTNYLVGECDVDAIIRDTAHENLKVICFGAVPPNPSELLASEAMEAMVKKLEQDFDYIIFDTPPIGVVSDAIPIIKLSDGVVLVAKHNHTTYTELSNTIDVLKRAEAKILGITLNHAKLLASKNKKYYKNYGYYS